MQVSLTQASRPFSEVRGVSYQDMRKRSRDTVWNQDLLWKVRLVNEMIEEDRRVKNFAKLQDEYDKIETNNFKRINVEKMRATAKKNRDAKHASKEKARSLAERRKRRHDAPATGTVAGHLHKMTQSQIKLRQELRTNPRTAVTMPRRTLGAHAHYRILTAGKTLSSPSIKDILADARSDVGTSAPESQSSARARTPADVKRLYLEKVRALKRESRERVILETERDKLRQSMRSPI